MRMRSDPPSAFQDGYARPSAIHTRPRSSIAIAIGCTTSGSAANTVAANPSGSSNVRTVSSADSGSGAALASGAAVAIVSRRKGSPAKAAAHTPLIMLLFYPP